MFLIAALLAVFALAGCNINADKEPQKIELRFGQEEAYFTGKTDLYPIAGEYPEGEDAVDSAEVTLLAEPAAQLRLSLRYVEGQEDIEGLAVSVNGGPAAAVEDGMILYNGAEKEGEAVVLVRFWLEKDSPYSNAGKQLRFVFVLSAAEQ